MLEAASPKPSLLASLAAARHQRFPYPHWLLEQVLPEPALASLSALPLAAPEIEDTQGRRETHNSSRLFFGPQEQARFPVCAALAAALQGRDCVARLESLTGARLGGSYLRVEYCQDRDGFWLEPHTDIGAKFFTMLIYLNDPPPGEDWGTDIYETPEKRLGPAPSGRNRGLVFIPGPASWHGFARRPITGIRRSLIINYVTPEWRSRHELSFPGQPVPGTPR